MIELGYSRCRMLADLGLPSELDGVLAPAHVPERLESERARVLVRAHAPDEVFPLLEAALARRFASSPRKELDRSLLLPLKKAVGNAFKRGNRRDAGKWISVEAVVTERGAFVQVSDQGAGFDVEETLRRFRAGETYFVHGGSGFRRYAKARSIVSFAGGGSSVLLRYLDAREGEAPPTP